MGLNLQQFVKRVCDALEVPTVEPDASTGLCTLPVEDVEILVYNKGHHLCLASVFGEPLDPADASAQALVKRLLLFNLKRLDHVNEYLSIDEERRFLLRKLIAPEKLNPVEGVEIFKDFLSTVIAWNQVFFNKMPAQNFDRNAMLASIRR